MPTFEFTSPEGKTYSVDGPEGATKEQAFQILQQHLGGSAQAAPQESLGSDLAKSAASGLEQGSATAIGLPGNLATLAHSIAPQGLIDRVKAIPGAQFVYNPLPPSQAILDYAKQNDTALVDPEYDPQSAGGRYTQAIARNAGPGLATGLGVGGTLASAVLGQGAYDATGSHLAEGAASLAGGIGAPLALAMRSRQAVQPLLNAAEVKAASNAQYADPLIRDTTISPQAAQAVAGDMSNALSAARSKFTPTQAPAVHEAIDNLANAGPRVGPPAPVSVEDLHLLRKDLGRIGQETRDFRPTEQATAAGAAKRVLDQYLDNIPSRDVVAGNPIDAVQALRDANANWRYSNSADKIGNIIQKATDKAGSQNSGLNYGNIQRQGLLPLLDNNAAKLKQMGMGSPDEIDAVRTAVQGDVSTNLLRRASNMLGGGGGIASSIVGHALNPLTGGVVGGEEGYRNGGLPGLVVGSALGALPGPALRMLANARTRRAAQAVQDAILEKAPANAGRAASNRAARAANNAAIHTAITQGSIPTGAMLLARFQRGNGG